MHPLINLSSPVVCSERLGDYILQLHLGTKDSVKYKMKTKKRMWKVAWLMAVKRGERCEGRTKFQFSKSVFHLENRRSVLLGTAGFCP